MSTDHPQVKIRKNYWKKEEEDLLRQWADKAQCYQWLHTRSRDVYQRKNAMYTIPVIVISTFVGTANFAQERFPEEQRKYVAMGVGGLSIVAGIISTVSQFLKISELNEAHRIAALSWGKFYRTVKTEISRHPLDRNLPTQVINMNKEEYDRLVEISPPVPKKVLLEFNKKFKKVDKLVRPEICDELSATTVYDLSEEERERIINNLTNVTKEEKRKAVDKKLKQKTQEVEDKYRETFFNLNGRYPERYEIDRYMQKMNQKDETVINMENNIEDGGEPAQEENGEEITSQSVV